MSYRACAFTPPPDALSPKEVMERTGLSKSEVYRLIDAGEFGQVWRRGKRRGIRVRPQGVLSYLTRRIED